MSGSEPLRLVLRGVLEDRGFSVRRTAKELAVFDSQHRDAPQSEKSWYRTLHRILKENSTSVFSPQTAAIVEEFFGLEPGYLVRPQKRESQNQEVLRLRAEIAELQAELDRLRAEDESDRSQGK